MAQMHELSKTQNTLIIVKHLLSGQEVAFTPFVTSFTDDHQSEWSETSTYGRMDDIATFKRTKRMISLEFDVPSEDNKEAVENMSKASKLKTFLYPLYEQSANASSISSAPLVRLKFINWVYNTTDEKSGEGILGFLKNIMFSPNPESGFFSAGNGVVIPRLFKLSLNLTPLHESTVGWRKLDKGGYGFMQGGYPYRTVQTANIPAIPNKVKQDANGIATAWGDIGGVR
jgi:hypothetical protein